MKCSENTYPQSVSACIKSLPGFKLLLALFLIAVIGMAHSPAQAQYISHTGTLDYTGPTNTSTEIIFHKNLDGFSNYGLDGNADILYQGDQGTWTLDLSAQKLPKIAYAYFTVALDADDHSGVPGDYYLDINSYTLDVLTNGTLAGTGHPNGIQHGTPFGSIFNNWLSIDYPVAPTSSLYTITLDNTNTIGGGNWYAIDQIDLHLVKASALHDLKISYQSSEWKYVFGVEGEVNIWALVQHYRVANNMPIPVYNVEFNRAHYGSPGGFFSGVIFLYSGPLDPPIREFISPTYPQFVADSIAPGQYVDVAVEYNTPGGSLPIQGQPNNYPIPSGSLLPLAVGGTFSLDQAGFQPYKFSHSWSAIAAP